MYENRISYSCSLLPPPTGTRLACKITVLGVRVRGLNFELTHFHVSRHGHPNLVLSNFAQLAKTWQQTREHGRGTSMVMIKHL